MDTQFHTPSLGDDILDLTDCEPQSDLGTTTTNTLNFNNNIMPAPININFPMPMTDYPGNQMPSQRILRRRNSVRNSVDFNHFNIDTPSPFLPPLSLGARKQIPPLDGTESRGPISPYGHFFRETACIIKQQNPNCSYQELTRIVSSMWLSLDANKKQRYQKKSEQSQGDYYKVDNNNRFQSTQQSHQHITTVENQPVRIQQQQPTPAVIKINLDENNDAINIKTNKTNVNNSSAAQTRQEERMLLETNIFDSFEMSGGGDNITVDLTELPDSGEMLKQQKLKTVEQEIFGTGDDQYGGHMQSSHTLMYDDRNIIDIDADPTESTAKTNTEQMLTEASSVRKCTRGNCNKRAIINPDWEDEYCSNECVVLHCRNIFEIWKANLAQT